MCVEWDRTLIPVLGTYLGCEEFLVLTCKIIVEASGEF